MFKFLLFIRCIPHNNVKVVRVDISSSRDNDDDRIQLHAILFGKNSFLSISNISERTPLRLFLSPAKILIEEIDNKKGKKKQRKKEIYTYLLTYIIIRSSQYLLTLANEGQAACILKSKKLK